MIQDLDVADHAPHDLFLGCPPQIVQPQQRATHARAEKEIENQPYLHDPVLQVHLGLVVW